MAGKTIRTELAEGGRVRIERMLGMVEYGADPPGTAGDPLPEGI